jgi:hypothetical protein
MTFVASIGVQLACFLLKLPLNMRQRTRLVGAILDSNNAVSLNDLIIVDSAGRLIVGGEIVDHELAVKLRDGARYALDNQTLKIVREQVAATAGKRGVSEGDTPEKLYFYRAALWWGKKEDELLTMLAARSE